MNRVVRQTGGADTSADYDEVTTSVHPPTPQPSQPAQPAAEDSLYELVR